MTAQAKDTLTDTLTLTDESDAALVVWLGGLDTPMGYWPTDDEDACREAVREWITREEDLFGASDDEHASGDDEARVERFMSQITIDVVDGDEDEDEDAEDEAEAMHDLGLAHLGQSQDVHYDDAHALHYDDATDAWYVIKSEDIESLGRLLDLEVEDAYSRWCSDTVSTEVDLEAIAADLDEDTDLDALRDEAGAAGDTTLALALTYLRDEIEEMVR